MSNRLVTKITLYVGRSYTLTSELYCVCASNVIYLLYTDLQLWADGGLSGLSVLRCSFLPTPQGGEMEALFQFGAGNRLLLFYIVILHFFFKIINKSG